MDISNIIVLSIVLIILLSLVVFSIDLFLPIQLKFEMNGICRSYIYKIESSGFLTAEDQLELMDALREIGLTNPSISIESDGQKYGDRVDVKIVSIYERSRLIGLFRRANEQLEFNYERTYFIRQIKN